MNGSNDSVNQLRPSFVSHRPSQVQRKKSRDSVPYKVIDEYIDNQSKKCLFVFSHENSYFCEKLDSRN